MLTNQDKSPLNNKVVETFIPVPSIHIPLVTCCTIHRSIDSRKEHLWFLSLLWLSIQLTFVSLLINWNLHWQVGSSITPSTHIWRISIVPTWDVPLVQVNPIHWRWTEYSLSSNLCRNLILCERMASLSTVQGSVKDNR